MQSTMRELATFRIMAAILMRCVLSFPFFPASVTLVFKCPVGLLESWREPLCKIISAGVYIRGEYTIIAKPASCGSSN